MTERHDWQTVRDELTPELRRRISWLYEGRCAVCGSRDQPHVDHIVPVSLGGRSFPENLWILCAEHNRRKGAQWPTFWLRAMILQRDEIRVTNEHARRGWGAERRDPILEFVAWHWEGDRRPHFLDVVDAAITSVIPDPADIPEIAKVSAIEYLFPS